MAGRKSMKFFQLIPALCLLASMVSGTALADSGTKQLTREQSPTSTRSCSIDSGDTCYFGSNAANPGNSMTFSVPSYNAIACFDSDTGSVSAGAAVVKFWRVTSSGAKAGSFIPSAATTSTLSGLPTDCFVMLTGSWWIEVSTPPAGSEVSLVTITGSGSQ
jgi:hypothetical protein